MARANRYRVGRRPILVGVCAFATGCIEVPRTGDADGDDRGIGARGRRSDGRRSGSNRGLALTSSAFEHGERIPERYGYGAENVNPPLEIENVPDEGTNNYGEIGYGGPDPPDAEHRYRFKLFAADATFDLPPETGADDLGAAMEGHVLEQTQLDGTFPA